MQGAPQTRRAGSVGRLLVLHRWYEARSGGIKSPPMTWEVLAVHGLYLLSGLVTLTAVLALTSSVEPIRANSLGGVVVMAAMSTALMVWTVLRRTPPVETWFVSHLVWLSMTWAMVAFLFASSLLVLGLILIAAVLLQVLAFLVYTPFLLAWSCAVWFLWRVGRGYVVFLRRGPIGSFSRP
jgi:hypothetical protein